MGFAPGVKKNSPRSACTSADGLPRTDLRFFDWITPCGIAGCRVTSLEKLLGQSVPQADVMARLTSGFSEVFGLDVVPASAGELNGWLASEVQSVGAPAS